MSDLQIVLAGFAQIAVNVWPVLAVLALYGAVSWRESRRG
ncbi:hypothetical protein HMPREF0063_10088 [Aeromicrobium marinum DSM 15272]|uniref:Uncharacterized protein n=1 Tax=Aeromicrobium marinum DSM 15272 TaxID=585531 RepID=E2S7T1_9ACTN|nr:hypothetical protein HMPREF0063_10088 [Aeromicrobium marinum DSM 15272]